MTDKIVCTCVNIRASTIQTAIDDGCLTVEAVKERTRACTGCQSCRPDIEAMIRATQAAK